VRYIVVKAVSIDFAGFGGLTPNCLLDLKGQNALKRLQ